MSYKPTGYPIGRPRKGEVRPLTARMIARRQWYQDNIEREQERQRLANEKFREEQPERWAEIQRGVRIRAKQWNQCNFVRGVGRMTKKIRLTATWNG